MSFMENRIIREDMENLYKRNIVWEELRNKTVMITGGYGMLASYVVFMCIFLNEIYKYNIKIVVVVRDANKLRLRFGEYVDRDYFVTYLEDITETFRIEGDVDFIVHAASLASSQYYFDKPIDVMMPNVMGTIRLLELAAEKKSKGFLFFSGGEIYGKVEKGISVIDETVYGMVNTLDLRNCYCESKRLAEMLCYSWYKQKKVPVKIARLFHTFGPTMDVENDKRVFSSFVLDILEGRNIIMESDGKSKRTFTYIADATAGYFKILLEGEDGNAYNLCNEQEFLSIRQFAQIAAHLYPQMNIRVEQRESASKIVNAVENEIAVSSKKLRDLGWDCQYNTRTGLQRTVEGIRETRKIHNCWAETERDR